MSSYSKEDILNAKKLEDLISIAENKGIDISSIQRNKQYEEELELLQIQLVHFQKWVESTKQRVAIIFEGRDAAGKGGAIKRFTEHLNPRTMRVVALDKPTETEKGQWYFRRYVKQLPNPGEIVFFDRSWYNRAVVEPIMGFCTDEEYDQFMAQVPEFEHMLYEDGLLLIKFWFSINKEEQKKRILSRQDNPLKIWKVSPVDLKGHELWDKYSHYRDQMFSRTHSSFSPWIIVKTDEKKKARLESIRYVLSKFKYPDKSVSDISLMNDPNIVFRYYRNNQDD